MPILRWLRDRLENQAFTGFERTRGSASLLPNSPRSISSLHNLGCSVLGLPEISNGPNIINRFALRFVKRSSDHLGQQTEQNTHHRYHERDHHDKWKRSRDKGHAVIHLQNEHPDKSAKTDEEAEDAATTEHVHRLGRRAIEKLHHEQVKQHLYDALQSVFAVAGPLRMMINGYFANFCSMPRCVDREEAVHFAVKPDPLDHMAFVGLQRTTKIVKSNT